MEEIRRGGVGYLGRFDCRNLAHHAAQVVGVGRGQVGAAGDLGPQLGVGAGVIVVKLDVVGGLESAPGAGFQGERLAPIIAGLI